MDGRDSGVAVRRAQNRVRGLDRVPDERGRGLEVVDADLVQALERGVQSGDA